MKSPAFQFYAGDWLRCAELRMCSSGARGLWIDMIAFMHQASPYGHLMFAGKPVGDLQLAKMVGEAPRDVARWLAELADVGVYSRNEAGVIYSRRMVRDDARRLTWKKDQDAHRARKAGRGPDKAPDSGQMSGGLSVGVSGHCQDVLPCFPASISTNNNIENINSPGGQPVDKTRVIDSKATPRPAAQSTANAERVKAENRQAEANKAPPPVELVKRYARKAAP